MYPRTLNSRLLITALALAIGGTAAASTPPETGLGQSWPNTVDVSTSPNWHVYLFQRGNTTYIQINDSNGNVRGAFAKTPYSAIGLPIGTDAANLATPDEPLPAPASKASIQVYRGNGVQVFVAPQPSGSLRMMMVSSECKGDPTECSHSVQ